MSFPCPLAANKRSLRCNTEKADHKRTSNDGGIFEHTATGASNPGLFPLGLWTRPDGNNHLICPSFLAPLAFSVDGWWNSIQIVRHAV
jgi:hypothetical protein